MMHTVGIEHELVGPLEKALPLLKSHYAENPEVVEFVYHGRPVVNYQFLRAGFVLKDETNCLDVSALPMIELAYDPITIARSKDERIQHMDAALRMLRDNGFLGYKAGPVSTQVNYSVVRKSVSDTLSLYRAAHVDPMKDVGLDRFNFVHEDVYEGNFTSTVEDLLEDYLLGTYCRLMRTHDRSYAWEAYLSQDALHKEMIARIIKFQRVKLASWLIWLAPDHTLSKAIESYEFIRSIPALEFREFNQTFDTASAIDHVLTLANKTEEANA